MKIYMAKKGDTLWILAEKFRVHPDSLFELNPHISNPEMLDPGVKVKIPIAPSPVDQPPMEFLYQHQVRSGDTLWKLSKAWNVPLKALIAVNPQLRNPNVLTVGELVNVPRLSAEIASAPQPASGDKEAQTVKVNVKAAGGKREKEKEKAKVWTAPMEAPVYQQQPFLTDEPGWIDQPYPHQHGAEAFYETEQMFWGEAMPTYTTNVTNPFDTYAVDPRINLPAYPEYEAVGMQQFEGQPQQEEESARPDNPSKRPKSKPGKAKGKRKSIKGAVAAISVQPVKKSKPIRKTSKPWSKF